MTESEYKAEVRLRALEYLACHTLSTLYRLVNAPLEVIDRIDANGVEYLRRQTVPGVSAAQSDLFAGEFLEAVVRLQKATREMIADNSKA